MQLSSGSRVCIIGGGPSGSFAALHLLALAQQAGKTLDIQIFEPRHASRSGGIGTCKGCAGIVSANAVKAIESLEIAIPSKIIQAEINEYILHMQGQTLPIQQPHPDRRILSVYRGSGPCRHSGEPIEGFDAFLLSVAVARGAKHIPERVQNLEWDGGPVVRTAFQSARADLVVLAIGVNSHLHIAPFYEYVPPATERMAQDEIRKPPDWPAHSVAVFFGEPDWMMFGVMVPKGQYLNVSLLGREMGKDAIRDFYQAQEEQIRPFFSEPPEGMCGCTPRVPVQPARQFYGDRWVAVGEAAISRLYKDGIFSAFQTSNWAMRTAMELGVTNAEWKVGYEPHYRRLAADNRYGEILFDISPHIFKNARLAHACIQCLRKEAKLPPEKKNYSRFFWGVLTGDETYWELLRLFLEPGGLAELGREIIRPEITA